MNYYGDYFIFFERLNENEIPGGGVVIYPAGNFDIKKEKMNFFKPNRTNIDDIK